MTMQVKDLLRSLVGTQGGSSGRKPVAVALHTHNGVRKEVAYMPQVNVKDTSQYVLIDDRDDEPYYLEVPLWAIEDAKQRPLEVRLQMALFE